LLRNSLRLCVLCVSALRVSKIVTLNLTPRCRAHRGAERNSDKLSTFRLGYFFSNAVQFMITVGGGVFDSPTNVPIKNRRPSSEILNSWKFVTCDSMRLLKR